MGVRERKERERQARLELIRRAALQLFAERGFARTSMDDVAARAELGKGTLYYYFPSKVALLEDVLDTYARRFFEHLLAQLEPEDDLFTCLEKILLGYVAFHAKSPEFFRLHYRWATGGVAEAGVNLDRFRRRYRELRAPFDELLARKARELYGGRVRPEVVLNLVGGILLIYGHHLQQGRPVEEVKELILDTVALLRASAARAVATAEGDDSTRRDANGKEGAGP